MLPRSEVGVDQGGATDQADKFALRDAGGVADGCPPPNRHRNLLVKQAPLSCNCFASDTFNAYSPYRALPSTSHSRQGATRRTIAGGSLSRPRDGARAVALAFIQDARSLEKRAHEHIKLQSTTNKFNIHQKNTNEEHTHA